MATELEDKQGNTSIATPNPSEAYYNRALNNAEQSSLYNPSDEPKSLGSNDLRKAESAQAGTNSVGTIPGPKEFGQMAIGIIKGNPKKAMGGGILGGALGLVVFGAVMSSGPAQIFRLAHILGKPLQTSESAAANRTNGLFRFARTGSIGQTRMSYIGSKIHAQQLTRLNAIGIDFNSNRFSGSLNSTTVDQGKLSKQLPELKNLSRAEAQAFIAKSLDIDPSTVRPIGEGKFAIVNRNFSIQTNRLFIRNTHALLGDGKISSAIKARPMTQFFNVPSLFHPIKRLSAQTETSIGNTLQDRERAARQKQLAEARKMPKTANVAAAESRIKGSLTGVKAAAGSALLLTGAMCIARDTANDIVEVNRANLAVPAALATGQILGLRDQTKDMGSDLDLGSMGTIVEGFTDKDGGTIWDSREIRALEDPFTNSGEPLPEEYRQGFSTGTNAATIKATFGGGAVGAVACSNLGIFAQLIAAVGLVAISVPTTGGTGAVLVFAGNTAKNVALTAGTVYLLQKIAVDQLKSDELVPDVIGGAIGGGLYGYGAMEFQGIQGRSSGGVAMPQSDVDKISRQYEQTEREEFTKKSTVAKIFDVKDYNSVASRTVGTMDTNIPRGVTNVATSVLSLRAFTGLFGTFGTSKANAAQEAERYDWNMPTYSIPLKLLNNPEYANPYASGDKMAVILDSPEGEKHIDRAMKCFGNSIQKGSQGWEVKPVKDVNPNSAEYVEARCDNLDDPNWNRMIMFVSDSREVDAESCFLSSGEDGIESCANNGIGSTNDTLGPSDQNIPAGPAGTCEAGEAAGQATGYQENKPVQITLCKVEGTLVNAQISASLQKMLDAARSQNIVLRPGSGYRTMEEQRRLYNCYITKSCNKGRKAAQPGFSNHQMGLAVDYSSTGGLIESRGTAAFQWLKNNAANYGFKNLPDEPWHWSIDGN